MERVFAPLRGDREEFLRMVGHALAGMLANQETSTVQEFSPEQIEKISANAVASANAALEAADAHLDAEKKK
jgi:hypothetical protein